MGLIHDAGEKATHLVEQILTFTGQDDDEQTPLDLIALVVDACEFLRATLPATVEIRTVLEDAVAPVRGNRSQIHQVLVNIGVNAAHAMPDTGGLVSIVVAITELDEDFLERNSDFPGDRAVRISVSDTGKGMDDETLAHIFEPFFTTKEVGQGTGLGLSVVRGIMDSHQGALEVRSVLRQGTTFDLYFPISAEEIIAPEETAGEFSQAPTGRHERVLIVEDMEVLRLPQVEMLESLGYSCLAAGSGAEALEEVKRRPMASIWS